MLAPQDSIVSHAVASARVADTIVAHKPQRPQTPYQVLRMLPRDATPAQQDSAIQAWFQPAEVHYSSRPDTLHLPGHGVGRSLKDVKLPQYYRETFFANDSLLHPELSGGRYGVAGDPVPYTVRGDDTITALLIACFVLTLVVFSHSRHIIQHQLKNFFFEARTEGMIYEESVGKFRFIVFLNLLTCLLLAIASFFYITHFVSTTFLVEEPYQLIGIFGAVFLTYFVGKTILYRWVNTVFFGGKKSKQWTWQYTFITALEGVALFPAVILQIYFNLPMQSVTYYLVFILFLVKMLTFYKSWAIFFRQNSMFLQIILYLCTLEIVPLLSLGGALVWITDVLKVNF